MENASAAFLTAVQRSLPAVRKALGSDVVDPAVLSCAERRQHSGWLRREDENASILVLAKQGTAIKAIVRLTGKSRKLVRQVVRGGRTDVFRSRISSLDPFLQQLEADWASGCHKTVRRCGTRQKRRALQVGRASSRNGRPGGGARLQRATAMRVLARWRRRSIARMMTTDRDSLSKTLVRTMAIIETTVPALAIARDLVDRFHQMVRNHISTDLEAWIADASASLLGSFAKGIVIDRAGIVGTLTRWRQRAASEWRKSRAHWQLMRSIRLGSLRSSVRC